MNIACPACQSPLEISKDFVGQKIRCAECEQKCQLPDTLEELMELVIDESPADSATATPKRGPEMTMPCPGCEAPLEVSEDYVGRKIRCPECEQKCQLPDTLEELMELVTIESATDGPKKKVPKPAAPSVSSSGRPRTVTAVRRATPDHFSWPLHVLTSLILGAGVATGVLFTVYFYLIAMGTP